MWNRFSKNARFAKQKGHKYGAKAQTCQIGHSHRSKLEASVCQLIQLRERAGEIKLLQAEDHCYLTRARILYVPDFKCLDLKTNAPIWVEAKGFETPEWRIKLRLWKHYGPGPLEIWKGSHISPKLDETIIPKENKKHDDPSGDTIL